MQADGWSKRCAGRSHDAHGLAATYEVRSRCLWPEQPRSEKEHRALVAAVEKGDADAAAGLLEKHILNAGLALSRALRLSRR